MNQSHQTNIHSPKSSSNIATKALMIALLTLTLFGAGCWMLTQDNEITNGDLSNDTQESIQTASQDTPKTEDETGTPKTEDKTQVTQPQNSQLSYEAYRHNISLAAILNDLHSRPALTIEPIDLKNKHQVETLHEKVMEALANNPNNAFSEHFILKMDDSQKTFQNLLKALKYEALYTAIMEKNRNQYGDQVGELPYPWIFQMMVLRDTDPTTGEKTNNVTVHCYPPIMNTIDYFSPDLELAANLNTNPTRSKWGKLMWFPTDKTALNLAKSVHDLPKPWEEPSNTSPKAIKLDLVPDDNLIIGLDGNHKELKLSNEMVKAIHKGYQELKYDHANDFINMNQIGSFEDIQNGRVFYIVDGRFISDGNTQYFILSYHAHSLDKMRESCDFSDDFLATVSKE